MSVGGDRFAGDAGLPQTAGWCDNCGNDICIGSTYYMHEGLKICSECAREYAWARFEETAARLCAAPETPLVMRPREQR